MGPYSYWEQILLRDKHEGSSPWNHSTSLPWINISSILTLHQGDYYVGWLGMLSKQWSSCGRKMSKNSATSTNFNATVTALHPQTHNYGNSVNQITIQGRLPHMQ